MSLSTGFGLFRTTTPPLDSSQSEQDSEDKGMSTANGGEEGAVNENMVSATAKGTSDDASTNNGSPTLLVGKSTNQVEKEEHVDALSDASTSSVRSNGEVNASCQDEADPAVVSKIHMLQTRDQPVVEDESLRPPIPLLLGEKLCRLGRTSLGDVVMLTTFRLFIAYSKCFVNVPLGLVEGVECIDAAGIQLTCKDGTVHSVVLASSDISFKWLHAIKQELAYAQSFADYFAVAFYITCTEGNTPWDFSLQTQFKLGEELRRQGFDLKKNWRISNINDNYEYCSSYPKENVVPKSFSDESLEKAGTFRSKHRFPSAVWRHRESGTVLLRSSQPFVGLFCQRSQDDEDLIQAIIQSCEGSKDMLIVDARPYTNAIGNRAKGGGWEFPDYYSNCEVVFMNMPNIHAVRTSFMGVRTLVSTPGDAASWYTKLNSTNWICNLSTLLVAANRVADALASKPVLVHCSDGWDRTPQICALAQLLLDPFYRTFKGFQVLIIKEWLQFGHKFADRCGNGIGEFDANEFSPIFLQWLDAVYQLTQQFPTAFEFNESCLIRLVHHTYSRMFGTFLFNNEKARHSEELNIETASVWSLLEGMKPQLINKLYTPGVYKVLAASSHPRDLQLWTNVYAPATSQTSSAQEEVQGLMRSRSYSDISVSTESNLHTSSRRLSDPDLSSSINLGDDYASTTAGIAIPSQPLASISNELIAHSFSSSPIVKLSMEQRSRNNSGASMRELMASKSKESMAVRDSITYAKYLAMDGLAVDTDPFNERLIEYEKEIGQLRKRIVELKNAGTSNGHFGSDLQDQLSEAPGSAVSNGSEQSDESWEDVSVREPTVTLWIPDHAVSYCCSCHSPFKVYRRKHHCRQCGLVFCLTCAGQFIEIPEQQLYEPVRVCTTCYQEKLKAKKGSTQNNSDTHSSSPNHFNCSGEGSVSDIIGAGGDIAINTAKCTVDTVQEPWNGNPSQTSSPVGSPDKVATGINASQTCSQESSNLEGSSEGGVSILMEGKAS